jgi:hypothetical protein
MAKWQLNEWGLDYFDLYLIHFPISLEFVDPSENTVPNWKGGADGQLHIGMYWQLYVPHRHLACNSERTYPRDLGGNGKAC